jgi:hypothetical protein
VGPLTTALAFTAAGTNGVNCGSDAALDNWSAGTVLVWFRASTTATVVRYLASKYNPGATNGWQLNNVSANGTQLRLFRHRATTDQQVSSPTGFIVAGQWRFAAAQWDVNGSPKMFCGSLTATATDQSTSVTAGSGTQVDDSPNNLVVGNVHPLNIGFGGDVASFRLVKGSLTPAEVVAHQWAMLDEGDEYQAPLTYCDLRLGENGAVVNYDRSGRGNHGTVSGAALTVGPPPRWPGRRTLNAAAAAPALFAYSRGRAVNAGAAGGKLTRAQLANAG